MILQSERQKVLVNTVLTGIEVFELSLQIAYRKIIHYCVFLGRIGDPGTMLKCRASFSALLHLAFSGSSYLGLNQRSQDTSPRYRV